MRKLFKRTEDFLVAFSRVFWVVISFLSFVVAIIFLLITLNKFFITENAEQLEMPDWDEVKESIFPPRITDSNVEEDKNKKEITDHGSTYFLETNLREVLNSIYLNFSDNDNYLSKIKMEITLKSLDNYLKSNYFYLYAAKDHNQILDGLAYMFNNAYKNSDFLKIGNYEKRYEFIENSMAVYFSELNIKLRDYQNELLEVQAINTMRKTEALIYFYIGASGIASFVFLVLFIIIFRVESHLKKISNENK